METSYRLFNISEEDIPALWDVIRLNVYKAYYAGESQISIESRGVFSKIGYLTTRIFRDITSLFYFIGKRGDLSIVAPCSRNVEAGVYYDRVCEDAIEALGKKALVVEDHNWGKKYRHNSFYPYFYVKWLRKKHTHYSISNENYALVEEALKNTFGICKIKRQTINNTVIDYLIARDLYRFIADKKRIKKFYYIYYGNIKGAIAACKEHSIISIDLQHCEIDSIHPVYSYPKIINVGSKLVIMPEALYTFGSYWGTNVNIPIKNIVAVGNDSYCITPQKIDMKDFVLVVSSRMHTGLLLQPIKDYATTHPTTTIVYKLHRDEYSKVEEYKIFFKENNNVAVFMQEHGIQDFLGACSVVIIPMTTTVSTVLYESLYYNKKVVILKPQLDEGEVPLNDNPGIFITDGSDFNEVVTNAIQSETQSLDGSVFFQKFDKKLFLKNEEDLV